MKKKRVTHPSQAPWDTQILFCDKNTLALKHWSAIWREGGGGGGGGTLILSYISRFCPFLEIQNFELHFLLGGGGGGGAEDQKNKYVWRYDEIMIYSFYALGGHFYQFGAF